MFYNYWTSKFIALLSLCWCSCMLPSSSHLHIQCHSPFKILSKKKLDFILQILSLIGHILPWLLCRLAGDLALILTGRTFLAWARDYMKWSLLLISYVHLLTRSAFHFVILHKWKEPLTHVLPNIAIILNPKDLNWGQSSSGKYE